MSKYIIILFLILSYGCSSKNIYKPKKLSQQSSIEFDGTIKSKIAYTTKHLAVLEDNTIIGDNIQNINNNIKLISITDGYIVGIDNDANIVLKKGNQTTTIPSQTKIVTATIKDGLLATCAIDNSTRVIDIATKKVRFINKNGKSYAIDIRISSPLFLENL